MKMPLSQRLDAENRWKGGKQDLKGANGETDETESGTMLQRSQWRAEAGQTWPPALLLEPPPSQ